MLHQQIRDEIKDAMIKKESLRLEVLRNILSSFTNELVAKKRKPSEELSDEEAIPVISRLVKQRKDSIEQFTKGNREDLAEKERDELPYLEKYLPEMMNRDEVEKIIKAKKEELGITDKSKAGMLMAGVMKDLKGKADGQIIKEIVDALLN
ncbi:MAG: GatB/YqeY domain-containing protein [Candidatus Paceibacterota bacterium]|jgi:hypothetical protein